MPLFQGLIPFREPSSSVFLDLARILSWFTRLLMSFLPVIAFALPGAILLGQTPAAPVHLLTEKKTVVTLEGGVLFLHECPQKQVNSVSIEPADLCEARLPVATDPACVLTDERPQLQVSSDLLFHHFDSGVPLARVGTYKTKVILFMVPR